MMAKSKKQKKEGGFWADFKAFTLRGNMIDMAVGIIIGSAFGKIVSSLVSDILMPPIGLLIGGVKFSELKATMNVPERFHVGGQVPEPVTINYGAFIQTILDFVIIALCIFLIVRLIMRLKKAKEEAAPPPAKPEHVALLEQIRDLLKK